MPSRDWLRRDGALVTLTFSALSFPAAPATPAALAPPTTDTGSFAEWLAATTPGDPVMAQMLITIIVFVGFLFTAPATPWGLILGAVVLIMTPWIPTFWGFGSTIAASIVGINVAVGAFTYKAWAARTEA